MFRDERGDHLVGLVHLPITGLRADDGHAAGFHGVFEAEFALDTVEGVGRTFDDGDFITGLEVVHEMVAHQPGAVAVIRSHERDADPGAGEDIVIESRPRLEGRQMVMMIAPKKK